MKNLRYFYENWKQSGNLSSKLKFIKQLLIIYIIYKLYRSSIFLLSWKTYAQWIYFRNNEVISQESLANAKVLVLPGPLSKFTELEMNSIRTFLNSGGNVLVTLGEGGENKSNTNINFLLEEFGIMVNNGK